MQAVLFQNTLMSGMVFHMFREVSGLLCHSGRWQHYKYFPRTSVGFRVADGSQGKFFLFKAQNKLQENGQSLTDRGIKRKKMQQNLKSC